MTVNEIRSKFLQFFQNKGHRLVESDSLVPKDDPTVLFTTAGMQQFKRQFLGHVDDYTTATTSQKCLRTDDLDEVGCTDFHHTFFEMLGNFSFGDYFKKEAITWAWEFLTKELKLDPERLCVSVYEEDSEAEEIWKNIIGIPAEKIFHLGGKSNFWPSNAKENGPNGPCGPCSEIFYDYEPERGTYPKDPDDDGGRFCEVWNLVFTQYNRKEGGELEPLPNKNIDTGMGLERLAGVLQGKKNNFETDVFQPILSAIDAKIQFTQKQGRNERYVIADHLRAVTFGIADGVIPSNKDRGSVMRRLIIEMTDIAVRQSGNFQPVIHTFIPAVINAMKEGYPYLVEKTQLIMSNVEGVEKAFLKVRKERVPEFEKIVDQNAANAEELGKNLFLYKSTYGLTVQTMLSILQTKNVDVAVLKSATETYEKLLKEDQEQSRAGSKMMGDVFTDTSLELDVDKTDFLGYSEAQTQSQVLKIFVNNESVESANEGTNVQIILDKTPFYAESGGQVGDSGSISHDTVEIQISDTQKQDDIYIHHGVVTKGTLKVNEQITSFIDVDRRLSIMRNHTATHLLQTALQEILGEHIKQQGSLVAEDRLRFDFTHHSAVKKEELQKIEDLVNVFMRACDAVTTEYLNIEEARQTGAKAFFAEKYGDTVRVVTIGKYSKEFCGGTHLGSTGQIGGFKIIAESAIAQGIRRIEAVTGIGAVDYMRAQDATFDRLSQILKSPANEIIERVETQSKKLKQLEKDYAELKFEAIKTAIVAGLDQTQECNGIPIYKNTFTNIEMQMLRKISDFVKKKLPSSLIILGAKSGNDASILIASSDEAIQKGYKANELIQNIAEKIGGRGGGKPQLAQAGGKNAGKMDEAIEELNAQLLQQS